jgi:hypothetical protein
MKEFIKKNRLVLLFAIAGGVAGFFYWKYVGCLSGTCKIKSVWYLSTLYGTLAGYVAGDLVKNLVQWFNKRSEAKKE